MSNTERFAAEHPRQSVEPRLDPRPEACMALQLEGALSAIAEHLSDLDRRQSEALQGMQTRLAGLGARADAMRPDVPGEFAAAFERIQGGVQMLADRLSGLDRTNAQPAAPSTRHHDHVAASAGSPVATPPSRTSDPYIEDAMRDAPAPLRSASPVAPRAERARPPIDPFGFTEDDEADSRLDAKLAGVGESLARDRGHRAHYGEVSEPSASVVARAAAAPVDTEADPDRDPWDAHSADVLTRLLAPLPPEAADPPRSSPSASALEATPGVERVWLEARFAEIAARIEHSLAELRPETALVTISDRIDGLEDRMAGALQDLATHADMAGLEALKAHIAELGGQIETARSELGRLESIEGQIARVLDQLATDRAVPGAASPDFLAAPGEKAAGLTEDDVRGIIEFATEHAVEQAARRLTPIASGDASDREGGRSAGIGEEALQAILESWTEKRQLGEEQTIGMLDTVQQALIRLLDRVEVIEQAQTARDELVVEQLAVVRDTMERVEQGPIEEARGEFGTLRAAPGGASGSASGADFAPAPTFGRAAGRSAGTRGEPIESADTLSSVHDEAHRSGRGRAAAAPYEPDYAPAAADPLERGRRSDDFIAAARRQARQSTADRAGADRAAVLTDDAPAPEAKGGGLGGLLGRFTGRGGKSEPRAEKQADSRAEPETADAAGKGSGKTYLMLAVAALVLAGGLLLFMRPGGAPRSLEADAGARPAIARTAPAPTSSAAAPDQRPAEAATPGRPSPADPKSKSRPDRPKPGSVAYRPDSEGVTGADHAEREHTAAVPLGISFEDRGGTATAEDIARAEHRRQLAQMSGQIAARTAAVQSAAADPAHAPAPTPASVASPPVSTHPVSTDPVSAVSASAGAAAEGGTRTLGEMPPAAIGPSSLRAAAASGDPSAEFEVAARFAQGKGVKQDFDQAGKWYQRAASRGHAPSQYRLGTLYERGLGVAEDPARARVWYQRAAEQGNVRAMHNLGVLAASRTSGTPDYATASHWFAEAAEYGLSDSQYNLAVLYESGLGVKRDLAEAYKWFAIAARNGDEQAGRRRDEVARRVAPAERAEVTALVAQWRAKPSDKLVNDLHVAGEAWKRTSRTAPAGRTGSGG